MINTDPVAVLLVAEDGVIDVLEASVGVLGAQDRKDLAVYQVDLAAGRTSQTQDAMFLEKFTRYFNVKKGKK
ncbi:hypothetical protein ES705_09408 [subsurface metagenome]